MLTGQPPFTARNQAGLITKHLNDVPAPFDLVLQIPSSLERSCLRALEKNPNDRQSDALVLEKELQAAATAPGDAPAHTQIVASASGPTVGRRNLWKWLVGFALLAALGVTLIAVGLAIKFWFDRSTTDDTSTAARSVQPQTPASSPESNTNPATTETNTLYDLRGTWTGTYGPTNQLARLIINRQNGDALQGVLEQGAFRVAFEGSVKSGTIHMKQTEVIRGDGWSLGEDDGTVSNNGKRISGTGRDAVGGSFGMSYNWSFSR
jgi:hypothetical protein